MTRQIFIKNWVMPASVGINPTEKEARQRLRLNVTFWQKDAGEAHTLDDVIDYAACKSYIAVLVNSGHHDFLETLADNIAELCMEDTRIVQVQVTLEKLDVFPDCESCGVTINRKRD
jgi:dihydroneopterin aldolase